MGRIWEVAWTEEDSAIVEGLEKMMNRRAVWEYLFFGNFGGSKEVKGMVDGLL